MEPQDSEGKCGMELFRMGCESFSGGSFPSARYTFAKWLRYRRSKSGRFGESCSGPYHQHQSLPSAINNSSKASRLFSSEMPVARSYVSRASSRYSHAWLSSSAPIQTSKLAL